MHLTVLGNARRYLAPLSAGSAYLLEEADDAVLLDAGPGTREALERLGPEVVARIRGVVVSHWHFDHVGDLVPVLKALPKSASLVIPPGTRERADALAKAFTFRGPFDAPGPLVEASFDGVLDAGALRLRFAPTVHRAPSVATSIEAPDGTRLVYAGDSAPCPPLASLARNADLLLLHTLMVDVEEGADHARVHATGRTAGLLAKEADVRAVLLSHVFHKTDPDALVAAVRATYPGPVEVAESGQRVEVTRAR